MSNEIKPTDFAALEEELREINEKLRSLNTRKQEILSIKRTLKRLEGASRNSVPSETPIRKKSPIEALNLSPRTYRSLKVEKIDTVGQLISLTGIKLLHIPCFGRKCLNEVIEVLALHGFTLKPE